MRSSNPARTLALAFAALSLGIPLSTMTGCGGGGGGGTVTLPAIAPAADPASDAGAAPATTSAPAAAAKVKAPGDAKVGDTTNCPVSGEEFVVTDTSPHAEVNGKTYYFCCGGCAKKFAADPAKYSGAKPKS